MHNNTQKSCQQDTPMSDNQLRVPLSDLPVLSLVSPDLVNGPWIAGGAAIQWYRGQQVGRHDIDVFFKDEQQFAALKNKISKDVTKIFNDDSTLEITPSVLIFNSSNAETYRWNEFTVQLIKSRYFDSVDQLLDYFDITACKLATDGHSWYTNHRSTEQHINDYILDMDIIRPDMAVKRMFKYWIYGYQPTVDLIERIQLIPDLQNNFANSTDYDA